MNIQSNLPDESRTTPPAHQPHVVAPPPPRPDVDGPNPMGQTTQHRSRKSVALHWLLMLGGFAALGLLGQLIG